MYGVGGNLLKSVQSFYVDSRACVWVENDVSVSRSRWIETGLRCLHGSLMYNYMDGVVREVNVRMIVKLLVLQSANCGKFRINKLLFADDTALVADSDEKLC